MKKAMISQPMNGLDNQEIRKNRAAAVSVLESFGYTVVDTIIPLSEVENAYNKALCCLGKSLEIMSECDAVCFCRGWEYARGCRIEHEAAVAYGLKIIYEA